MNALDSRALSYLNCFAQKFSVLGRVRYRLTTAAGACLPVDDDAFTIEVGKNSGDQGQQHNITVQQEGRTLVAEPRHLEIEEGDMVLWHAATTKVPAFSVRGESGNRTFDSSALSSESVFTHVFGSPDTYEWMDANGSQVRGVVEVVSPDARDKKACQSWLHQIANGTLIHIVEDTPEPSYIKIITGQTVFWAVESASGITITDARLIQNGT